jgi:regulator of protease activity HflC (stomatin/prohibitin superfamily)
MIRERKAGSASGWLMLFVLLALMVLFVWMLINGARGESGPMIVGATLGIVAAAIGFAGLTVVNPNEGVVVQLFGTYLGSLRSDGFWWVNPLTTRKRVSMRIRNFESARLKVNDHDGNPVEIAAVVVWKVVDSAEAMFEVDNYENFVHVQSEAALRNLATTHPYDAHEEGQMSLRGNIAEVAEGLKAEVTARLQKAGVEVLEARISHLAYAQEIAQAMLQRQQASAIIAARAKIVAGAVGMVEMALEELSKKQVVQLDEERKAAMVSNLLVVLCGDRNAQPIVNAGTLHH